jgi:hypothetical protein
LKYTYFRNKSQQKSACAKKELRPLTQPQLVQQLLREKKPFFTAACEGMPGARGNDDRTD